MNIIFLDVDGVLDSLQYWQTMDDITKAPIDPDAVRRLKDLVGRAGEETEIVLTSSWRGGWEKDPEQCGAEGEILNDTLGREGLHILDKTPVLGLGTRPEEIRAWLDAYPGPVDSFVILDDADFRWEEAGLTPYWVQTDFQFSGLQDEHVEKALEILSRRPLSLRWRNWKRKWHQ